MAKMGQRSILGSKKDLKKVALVTDSASDITGDIAREFNISIIPIYIHYNGKEFKDGINIECDDVYRLQKEKKVVFSTSSPSPHDFVSTYEKFLKEYHKIISIHISANLSAVMKSALIARNLLKEEKRIEIFDSRSGTMGTGFMVLAAAKAVRKGYSFKKIMEILSYLRDNVRLYATIDTLKYLNRSGRVPAIASFASKLLTIKPLLGINNGKVGMIGVAVTRFGSLREITRRVLKDFKEERWVMVSVIHTMGEDESRKIISVLQKSLNTVYSLVNKCTPAIGAHTGSGLIGIIVTRLNREIAELFI